MPTCRQPLTEQLNSLKIRPPDFKGDGAGGPRIPFVSSLPTKGKMEPRKFQGEGGGEKNSGTVRVLFWRELLHQCASRLVPSVDTRKDP